MPTEQEFSDLRAEVARLAHLVEQLYYRSGIPMASPGVPSIDSPPPAVIDLVRERRLIEAIKLWRELTGLTLAEAKRDIDELNRRLG
jgi:ribosomal protein L7/L12